MSHRLLVGLDYNGKRAEAGEIVNDLPAKSVSWLVEQGLVEPVSAAKKGVEVSNANV